MAKIITKVKYLFRLYFVIISYMVGNKVSNPSSKENLGLPSLTFFQREKYLRNALKISIEHGGLLSTAQDLYVGEKVLRNFISSDENTLQAKNYNKIIKKLAKGEHIYLPTDWGDLITFLKITSIDHPYSLICQYDFAFKYDNPSEDQKVVELASWVVSVEEDSLRYELAQAQEILKTGDSKKVTNHLEKMAQFKEDFEKKTKEIFIWGSLVEKFLQRSYQNEVRLFFAKGREYDPNSIEKNQNMIVTKNNKKILSMLYSGEPLEPKFKDEPKF